MSLLHGEYGSSILSRPTKCFLRNKMARYTSQDAVNAIGNRYDMVLIAAARVKELRRGHKSKLISKNGPVVTALTEIEQKLIGIDYLKRINTRDGKARA